MSEKIERYDEFEDLSLPEEKDENSNLDEYGVWIKKKPSINNELQPSEERNSSIEDDEVPFDFDGHEEAVSYEDSFEKELIETEVSSGEMSSNSDFDDIDMSNFFTDLGDTEESDEISENEDEETLKMDLNFETVDSYVNDNNNDDFNDMFNNAESSSNELDDFLSDLNSTTSHSIKDNFNDSGRQDIELNIDIDENQDFSNIGKSSETEESVVLPHPVSESVESNVEEKNESPIVIKNTIVEPENIDEIRKENRKVMGEEQTKELSDVEALANDLTSDISNIASNLSVKEGGMVCVEGIDRITELLTDIVKELSSMKNEISTLKASTSFSSIDANAQKKKDVDKDDGEANGFFKDEDTDEAIALTGDELNNILITADFTEENESTDGLASENEMEVCEACSNDEAKSEGSFSSEKDVDFDDITLENSRLDDFVIPEELDYSMLSNEGGETTSTEGSDMSYLDEKDSEDDVFIDIPESQDINVEDSVTTGEDVSLNAECSNSDALPSNIKREVKSVLAYMDQLLESLPEDKMKEFAESEYFEMYNRLFNELGIS